LTGSTQVFIPKESVPKPPSCYCEENPLNSIKRALQTYNLFPRYGICSFSSNPLPKSKS